MGPGRRGRVRRSGSAGSRRSPISRRASSTTSSPCATTSHETRRRPTSCSAAWAARRSPPRSSPAPTASRSPCSTRPTRTRCARLSTTASTADRGRHLVEVRARRSRPTARSASTRRPSAPRASTRSSASSSSPTRARRSTSSARADGYRVFNADPNVGGRYSALTAFGLVPSGLAGVDIRDLLDEAEVGAARARARHRPTTPASCSAPRSPAPRRSRTSSASSPTARTSSASATGPSSSIAESTGKEGKGILPGRARRRLPRARRSDLPDLQIVRLVEDERATHEVRDGEIEISGTPRRAAARLGVRDGGRRPPARHQPVRPARRRVGQDRHPRRCSTTVPSRPLRLSSPTAASRCARSAARRRRARHRRRGASTPCSPSSARRRLPLGAGLPRPGRTTPSSRSCATPLAARSRSAR